MDIGNWIGKVKSALDRVWGSITGRELDNEPIKPLEVTARTPTGEEQRRYSQDVGRTIPPPTPTPTPTLTPTPTQMPTPTPTPAPITAQDILAGLMAFSQMAGKEVPLATQGATLATAGNQLPDPYMPAVLGLKETRGGLDLLDRQRGQYNPYNIMPGGQLVDYPSFEVATLGGEDEEGRIRQGLLGILLNGLYQKYLESGNLEDFFNVYSPPGAGNPPMGEQVADYDYLRNLFLNR